MRTYCVASLFGVLILAAAGTSAVAASSNAETRRSVTSTVPPRILLSRSVGPPTSRVRVRGDGFGSFERVDIFVGKADLVFTGTNAQGHFGPVTVALPANAVPGRHWISAWGGRSGRFVRNPFIVRTDWPTFQYSNQHTGDNPYENVLNPRNVSRLTQDWRFPMGAGYKTYPVVADGLTFLGSHALNAATGTERWASSQIGSAVTVANGVVFGWGLGVLYALSAATGKKLWSLRTHSYAQTLPAVAHGVVYTGINNDLYALDATTGTELWTFPTGGPIEADANTNGSPAVADGVVYFGSEDGNLYALNAVTGKRLWNFGTGNPITATPTVAHGVVYIGSGDVREQVDTFYALDAVTGKQLWTSVNNGFAGDLRSATVANGVLYIGSNDGNLYALDATTGTELWNSPTGSLSSPTVANGVVYTCSNGSLYALNAATGTELYKFTTKRGVFTSPVVTNGEVYVDSTAYSYALHLAGGPTHPRALAPQTSTSATGEKRQS